MQFFKILLLLFATTKSLCEDYYKDTDTASSEFTSIVTTPCFVDKTSMIKAFFNPTGSNVLITAPRRFGKSTNMDMLKQFVEVTVDKNGNTISNNETEKYKVFSKKYVKVDTMEYLDVYEDTYFFHKHFGEYPVIYLDFKSLSGMSYKSFISSFRQMVNEEFRRHKYVLENKCMDKDEEEMFRRRKSESEIITLTDEQLWGSMKLLSKVLYNHFDTNVIVLIDEFDSPVHQAIFGNGKELGKIVTYIKKFLSYSLKSNHYVERALINALARLSAEGSSDLNNVKHLSFGEYHPFCQYYGFTHKEVRGLANKFNISENMAKIKAWYDGYTVVGSSIRLFNTLVIVEYFSSREFSNYWSQTGTFKNLQKMFLSKNIRWKIFNLLDNRTENVDAHVEGTIDNLRRLRTMVKGNIFNKLTKEDVDLFLVYMLHLGYFTRKADVSDNVMIVLPNKELRDELKTRAWQYYRKTFDLGNNMGEIRDYLNAIHRLGKDKKSHKELATCILHFFTRIAKPSDEEDLRVALAGTLVLSEEFKEVRTEVTWKTMSGRLDILIVRYSDNTGIIIELKYFKKSNEKKYSKYKPVEQIIKRKYYKIFDTGLYNVSNRIYVGVLLNETDTKFKTTKGFVSVLYNSIDVKDKSTVIFGK